MNLYHNTLKTFMATDPDLISSMIVRDCVEVFSPILAFIFNLIYLQKLLHFLISGRLVKFN